MRKHFGAGLLLVLAVGASAAELDHSRWDALLRAYVTPQSLVDYGKLKEHGIRELDSYLGEIAAPWPDGMEPEETKAALINAYNALTVRWILANYPVKSIWRTSDPFRVARHTLDGAQTSLDQIEGRLREMGDPRIHGALVCAARSCPPLRGEVYSPARIDEQLDDNMRHWLADTGKNEFVPSTRTARVSAIFNWYGDDFKQSGGVRVFLAHYAPADASVFLISPGARIEFATYHWGLNDASPLGADYSQLNFYMDWARNGYLWVEIKNWFFGLGQKYGVNPIIFGSIYVGAIPFFSLSVAWLIRNIRRRKSAVVPAFCTCLCLISSYLYLIVAGKNIPVWVYCFIVGMVGFGLFSVARRIRTESAKGALEAPPQGIHESGLQLLNLHSAVGPAGVVVVADPPAPNEHAGVTGTE